MNQIANMVDKVSMGKALTSFISWLVEAARKDRPQPKDSALVNKLIEILGNEYIIMIQDSGLQTALSPAHYNVGKVQPIDVMFQQGIGLDFCLGNIIKYASRAKHKGQIDQDLRKIIVYALFAINARKEGLCDD